MLKVAFIQEEETYTQRRHHHTATINQKKDHKTTEIELLNGTQFAKVNEDVVNLDALIREQAEMDKIRAEEEEEVQWEAQFEVNSAEMEKGLCG